MPVISKGALGAAPNWHQACLKAWAGHGLGAKLVNQTGPCGADGLPTTDKK